MVTSSEVTVSRAGIDQRKALRRGPHRGSARSVLGRGVCDVTPAAGGGGPPCAVGFQGTESVREERRPLSTHSVACTSVTVGNPHLALRTTRQGRHYHVPLQMKTLRLGEVKGSAGVSMLPLWPSPPGEIVATALARLLLGLVWENKQGRAM